MKRCSLTRVGVLVAVTALLASASAVNAVGEPTARVHRASIGVIDPSLDPVVIGTINPSGTNFYNVDDELSAMNVAVENINAAGGINGRELMLDWCNEGGDANKATACARQMVDDDVVAVVAAISTTNPAGMTDILNQNGIPSFGAKPLAPQEHLSPNVYILNGVVYHEIAGLTQLAANEGLHRVALVRNDVPFLTAMDDIVTTAATATGGELVTVVTLPAGSPIADYAPYATEIVDSGADFVILPLAKPQIISMIKALRSIGSDIVVGVNGGAMAAADWEELGADAEGALEARSVPTFDAEAQAAFPGVAEFVRQMDEAFGAGDEHADLRLANPNVLMTWTTINALADIMRGLDGDITTETLTAAINAARDIETGVIPPWTPSAQASPLPEFPRVSNTYVFFTKIEGGVESMVTIEPFDTATIL